MGIKIKYHIDGIDIIKFEQGNWIDLKSSESIMFKKGDVFKLSLGVSMELPKGYEAIVAPRSSTFKNFGVMLVNSIGIIDTSYCGDSDVWFAEFFALRDGEIKKGDRILQFRVLKSMDSIDFKVVDKLDNVGRGGHGSTGI